MPAAAGASASYHDELAELGAAMDALKLGLSVRRREPGLAALPPALEPPPRHAAAATGGLALSALRASVLRGELQTSPQRLSAVAMHAAAAPGDPRRPLPLLTVLRPLRVGGDAAEVAGVNDELAALLGGSAVDDLAAAFGVPASSLGDGARYLLRSPLGDWGSVSLRVAVDGRALLVTHASAAATTTVARPLALLSRVAAGDTRRSLVLHWRPPPHAGDTAHPPRGDSAEERDASVDAAATTMEELVAADEAQRNEWLRALSLLAQLCSAGEEGSILGRVS